MALDATMRLASFANHWHGNEFAISIEVTLTKRAIVFAHVSINPRIHAAAMKHNARRYCHLCGLSRSRRWRGVTASPIMPGP